MTGNNKVWRAPVAGLASVAMLATLGVSAMTANAATTEFTFKVDGGLEFDPAYTSAAVTVEDATTATVEDQNNNGRIDKDDVTAAEQALTSESTAIYQVTGWESDGNLVATDQASDPQSTATTVNARYDRKNSVYEVNFVNANGTPSGIPSTYVTKSQPKLASWQFPTDSSPTDGMLLTGFVAYNQNGNPVVDSSTDLSKYVDNNSHTVKLAKQIATSTYVTFSHEDWGSGQWTLSDPNNTDTPFIQYGEDFVIEVIDGQSLADMGVEAMPQAATTNGNQTQVTSRWSAKNDKDSEFKLSDPVHVQAGGTTLKPNYGVTTGYTIQFQMNDSDESAAPATQFVAAGKLATEPTATKKDGKNVKYTLDGWYDGTTKFDFSKAPTKNVTLHPVFKVSAVRVLFDPNYGKEPVAEKWFQTGDYFEAPAYEREGYKLDGWKYSADGTHFYDAPLGKKVTVYGTGDDDAYLQWIKSSGEGTSDSGQLEAGRTYVASWSELDPEETLTQVENYVDSKHAAEYYTADSYDQYLKSFEDYLAKKKDFKKDAYTEAEYQELLSDLKDMQAKLVEVGDTELYRVYNPNNGDHYFTTNSTEADRLVKLGWKAEGAPYKVCKDRTEYGAETVHHNFGTAVWSVYNPNTGEHLLTFEAEADALANKGWVKENLKFYTVQNGSQDVVRVYNPNTSGPAHLYTKMSEASILAGKGWIIDNNAKPVFTLD